MGIQRVAVREKLEDTLDDETNLAGLEASVPEELEHWIVSSNFLRTFDDARLGIVTSCGSEVWVDNSRFQDVNRKLGSTWIRWTLSWILLQEVWEREDGSSSPRDGCFKCD